MADSLNIYDERRVAVEARCDPRTVRAYMDPDKRERMVPAVAENVRRAMVVLGFLKEGSAA